METRYMNKISDKRTIAQKYGDKGAQEKKQKTADSITVRSEPHYLA